MGGDSTHRLFAMGRCTWAENRAFKAIKIRADLTMGKKCIARLVVVTTALTFSLENASAQGPGGNAGRGGAAAANAGDRVQGQINQRAQTQVQQRVQAQTQTQVQSRVQGQMQGRIQAEAQRAAEVAQRAADNSARRAGGAPANALDGARGNVAAGMANPRANTGLAIAAEASRFNGFAEADVAIYDNIFGRFNPIRPNANEEEAGSRGTANGAARRSSQADQRANPNASAGANARGQGPQNLDIARGIQVAAQQRRAEIAQMRDQAIATGQTDLLLRADEMELRLNAFVEAQQQLERGRAGQASPPRTANRLNGSVNGSTQIQN